MQDIALLIGLVPLQLHTCKPPAKGTAENVNLAHANLYDLQLTYRERRA